MPENPQSPVEISVVVRSHNDAGLIRETLTRLCAQTVADRMEILLFDDNSTDGTLEAAASFPSVTVVPWDGMPYNPPRVLNRAVDAAHGKIIVFNNSDAIPLDDGWLAAADRAGEESEGVCRERRTDLAVS